MNTHDIMNIIDNNSDNIQENDYLQISNSLKHLHEYNKNISTGTYVEMCISDIEKIHTKDQDETHYTNMLIQLYDVRVKEEFDKSYQTLQRLENYIVDLPVPVFSKSIKHYCLKMFFKKEFPIDETNVYEDILKKDHLKTFLESCPYFMTKITKSKLKMFYIITYENPLSIYINEYIKHHEFISIQKRDFVKSLMNNEENMVNNLSIFNKYVQKISKNLHIDDVTIIKNSLNRLPLKSRDSKNIFYIKVKNYEEAVTLLNVYDNTIKSLNRKNRYSQVQKKFPVFSFTKKKQFLFSFCIKHSIKHKTCIENNSQLKDFEEYLINNYFDILNDSRIHKNNLNLKRLQCPIKHTKTYMHYFMRQFYLENIESDYKKELMKGKGELQSQKEILEQNKDLIYKLKIKTIGLD